MTYEEKYKRAFEIAKEVYHDDRKDKIWREWLTKLFPELKKSEEERIRKWLIGYFQQYRIDGMEVIYTSGFKVDDIIAWLEKQVEKKPYEWHSEDEQNLNATLSYIDDEYLRRWLKDIIHAKYEQCGGCINDKGCVTCVDDNMKEQKVEPKFKAGDWIIGNEGIFKILQYDDDGGYNLTDTTGCVVHFVSPNHVESNFNLWTIQDAKDGDVLACPSDLGDRMVVFIFKQLVNHSSEIDCRCCIDACGIFDPCLNDCCYLGDASRDDYTPATKEQRDLLFQKMRESGYEWDAEKKELKKMEVVDKESEDERIRKGIIRNLQYLMDRSEGFVQEDLQEKIVWLENQGNVDKASYEIAEKEKYDFVSGQFIECRKSFNEFKEDNSYWFEYVGNDTYIGRSDNILNKRFHITPMQLYRLFTQQHCPKENDVNEETNAPTGYGKYVDECLHEAAEHFFSEGEDKYSVADLFYAGVRCGKSCLEKQGEQKQTWKPTAAQLIVIKDLIEDKNTSKVNKVILRGMFDEFKQFTNGHKREIEDAYLKGICDAKHEIEKAR